MLWPVQNTTSFQTMLVALVSNLWLRPKRKRGCALDIQGGCMMVQLYVGYRLNKQGFFERLVCAEWHY